MSGVEAAGSWDPAALLLAGPTRVRDLIVEGRVVVEDGSLTTVDLRGVLSRQRALPKRWLWKSDHKCDVDRWSRDEIAMHHFHFNICPILAPDPSKAAPVPRPSRHRNPLLSRAARSRMLCARSEQKTKGARPMRRFTIPFVLSVALAACTPTPGTERVSAGESVDIASAGAQLSVQRAQNGLVRPLGYSPALQAAAESHAQYLSRTGNFSHDGRGRDKRAVPRAAGGLPGLPRGREHRARAARYPQRRGRLDDQPGPPRQHPEPAGHAIRVRRAGSVWVLVLARPC
jgi:hypothetical protein